MNRRSLGMCQSLRKSRPDMDMLNGITGVITDLDLEFNLLSNGGTVLAEDCYRERWANHRGFQTLGRGKRGSGYKMDFAWRMGQNFKTKDLGLAWFKIAQNPAQAITCQLRFGMDRGNAYSGGNRQFHFNAGKQMLTGVGDENFTRNCLPRGIALAARQGNRQRRARGVL